MSMVDKIKIGYDVVLRSELDEIRDVEQEIGRTRSVHDQEREELNNPITELPREFREQQEETRNWVQQQIDNALNKGKERDLKMKNEAQKQHKLLLKEISNTKQQIVDLAKQIKEHSRESGKKAPTDPVPRTLPAEAKQNNPKEGHTNKTSSELVDDDDVLELVDEFENEGEGEAQSQIRKERDASNRCRWPNEILLDREALEEVNEEQLKLLEDYKNTLNNKQLEIQEEKKLERYDLEDEMRHALCALRNACENVLQTPKTHDDEELKKCDAQKTDKGPPVDTMETQSLSTEMYTYQEKSNEEKTETIAGELRN
ncbi:unnamed protein product [Cylicocyclus nassatus]|uniref:Uncharacterized protein n=1 Tax=Cylicocyclus nassatus TaxID=53992 RepID=A0AA36GCN3_CYLNA|nr:unnamed protein product [Cylicocyclus nassatus]